MKHIKRVKTAIATLAMGGDKMLRQPAIVMFVNLPKNVKVAKWEENSGDVPFYEIFNIEPVKNGDKDSILVDVSFMEAVVPEAEAFGIAPNQYTVTMDLHHIVLAHNLSFATRHLNIVAVPYNLHSTSNGLVKNTDITIAINFPERDNPIYAHLMKQMSSMVSSVFTDVMIPESFIRSDGASGLYGIPLPVRRFQMAIMPLISTLALDDTHALRQIIQMENVFNDFHARNFNENDDLNQGEYLSVTNALRDSDAYASYAAKESIDLIPAMEYSILDNMTDAMEEHIRQLNPEIDDPRYFKDLTLLILLSNTRRMYASTNEDTFLSVLPVVKEDESSSFNDAVHLSFMDLVSGLDGVFDEVEVAETAEEKDRKEKIAWWNQTPDQYWPEGLSKMQSELMKLDDSEDYLAIMKESLLDYAEMREVVKRYGLGKVFTAMVVKTSLNLHKMKIVQDTDSVYGTNNPKPYSLIAKQWIDQPSDDYLWELPAMSYALANYEVENFISLLRYKSGNTANYASATIHSLTLHLIEEAWDRANLEYLLVEHSGMPKKERELLLSLVDEIHNVRVDKDEVEDMDEEEINHAIAFHAVKTLIENGTTIDEATSMIAYAIPAFADIFVNTVPEFIEDEDSEDSEADEKVHIGSVEWKRQRVLYIETILDRVSTIVERKSA